MAEKRSSGAPVTDRALASLSHAEKQCMAARDRERLVVERRRVAPRLAAKMSEPVQSIANMMREWERLIHTLEAGWTTTDHFLVDDYLFALDMRAALEQGLLEIEPRTPGAIAAAVRDLDGRFFACTVGEEGGGGAGILDDWVRPLGRRSPEWLWNRRPRVLPW